MLLALGFAVLMHFWQGRTAALQFLTGYVLEVSLSVDNLFVFLLIFQYFRVPEAYQHKVLFWGILGALFTRGIFILTGVELIQKLHWVTYFFGAFLVYSGFKLFRQRGAKINPDKNPLLRLFRRWVPVTENYEGDKFFVRRPNWSATPLLIVLLVVETTDIAFCGRFGARYSGHHPKCLHRLYLERLRHPGIALHVFCSRGHDEDVRIFALWLSADFDSFWKHDAGFALLSGQDGMGFDRGGWRFARIRAGVRDQTPLETLLATSLPAAPGSVQVKKET